MSNFSLRIKELRESAGLFQSDLAERLNVSRACVSSWECGRTEPSVSQIISIAKIFNVSINYLVTGESNVTDVKSIIAAMPHLDPVALKQINTLSAYLLNIT